MNWTALGVLIPTVLSVLALLIGWRGRQRAASAAVEAGERADRTEAIAERAAIAAERTALVMERQAVDAAREAPTPRASWTLEHFDGDTFLLTNAGRATAYDVRVDTGDLAIDDDIDRTSLDPEEQIRFMTVRTLAVRDDTVTVTWAAEPGGGTERSTWSRPLPPRRSASGSSSERRTVRQDQLSREGVRAIGEPAPTSASWH